MSLTSVRLPTNLLSKSRLLMCWWPEGCFSVPATTASFQCLLGITPYGLCLHANFDLFTLPLVFSPFTPVSPLYSFFPPSSSLPISSVGCLYVSETKQTESCVTQCSWETRGPQMSTAASSFVGHVLHSPDVSRRLSTLFWFDPVPLWKGSKVGLVSVVEINHIFNIQCIYAEPKRTSSNGLFCLMDQPQNIEFNENFIWEDNKTIKTKFLIRWAFLFQNDTIDWQKKVCRAQLT